MHSYVLHLYYYLLSSVESFHCHPFTYCTFLYCAWCLAFTHIYFGHSISQPGNLEVTWQLVHVHSFMWVVTWYDRLSNCFSLSGGVMCCTACSLHNVMQHTNPSLESVLNILFLMNRLLGSLVSRKHVCVKSRVPYHPEEHFKNHWCYY